MKTLLDRHIVIRMIARPNPAAVAEHQELTLLAGIPLTNDERPPLQEGDVLVFEDCAVVAPSDRRLPVASRMRRAPCGARS
jgi:hypothetical protein